MLDRLLKQKSFFYSKCKSYLKMTKIRLDTIRKKKNSVNKYLKNDIADLLRNGLDFNAYGRAGGLLTEQNMMSCYDFLDNFCRTISADLSLMDKQSECPEDCRVAVASLMYAAARFAELPELWKLQNMFSERYGDAFEAFTSKEFVEKLRPKDPTKELKFQLMQEIALEFSIQWNSKSLEQQLNVPPPTEKKYRSLSDTETDENEVNKTKNNNVSENANQLARKKPGDLEECIAITLREKNDAKDETTEVSTSNNTCKDTQTDSNDQKSFYRRFFPSTYLKPEQKKSNSDDPTKANNPSSEEKPKPRSVRRIRNSKPPPGREEMDNKIDSRETTREAKEDEASKRSMANLKPSSCNVVENGDMGESPLRNRNTKSLPSESRKSENNKCVNTQLDRGSSIEQEMGSHVNPKPLEYEDFMARFAAIRGK